MDDVYQKLLDIRLYKKLSWKGWAEKSGLSEIGLRKMFEKKSLTVINMVKLCEAVDISPSDLFETVKLPEIQDPKLKLVRAQTLIKEAIDLIPNGNADSHSVQTQH